MCKSLYAPVLDREKHIGGLLIHEPGPSPSGVALVRTVQEHYFFVF
jgi:hypothetical protein